jgi:putative IMPACT (imprinted ancient) family translation regulator
MREIRLVLDYAKLDGFTRELSRMNGELLDKEFGERVSVVASVPANEAAAMVQRYAGHSG